MSLAGCGHGDDDFHVTQPPEHDGAVDAGPTTQDAGLDATTDAVTDATTDAPAHGADLAVSLTASPDPVAASAALTYTIDVTNQGALDATNVVMTQRLPAGNVQFTGASGIGWTCNAAGQIVTCTRATLLVGAGPSITVAVTVPATGGSLTTSVTVAADQPDPALADNAATATTQVLTPADLAIAISDAPDPVAAGGALTYTITVTNQGPGSATGVTVLDSLPGGLGFVSASGTGWSCSALGHDVTCLGPVLAPAASSVITLIATAPASGGAVTNTATVGAATPDPSPGNNAATATTTVNAAADLAIAVTDTPDPVLGQGTLEYAIDVTNLGPDTASGVTVTDSLPAGNVALVSASGSGWTCTAAGQVVSCTRPALLVGAAPTITLTVQAPSEAATLVDTATVASTSSDLEPANNAATATTTVLSAADLSVSVIDAPDPATTGGALSYTVTARNAGPSQASSVSVISALPAGAVFRSATGIGWTCDAIGQQVTCTAATLAVGTAPAITIVVDAPGVDGAATETSTIASATADPAPANNTASETTVINAPSDLALALTAQPSPVPAHATLTYTIGVTNLGPRDATNLVVTNRLPDGDVLFLGATGIGWTCALAGQIVTCTRPLLLVGAAPSITIQITTPGTSGDLIDQATVSATTADLDLANNTASLTTTVFDSADLSITASESPAPVRIGTELDYTLSVANDGPTAATAVSVVDTLPAGTTFVAASGAGWTCANAGQQVTCTMATLGASSSAPAITITATAPATAGNITNTATVSSQTSDPDATNDTATTTTLANAFADLSVTVTDSPDPVQGLNTVGCGGTECVSYAIDVANAGPDPATGIKVTTELPPNGTFYSAFGTGWVCPAPSGGKLTCTRSSLAVGAAPTIVLTWKAPSPGGFSIVTTSTVSGSSTDPDPTSDSATEDTTVLP